ncbi:hypothetical protein PoB_003762100 [Plakobranchus ocellatus]|uniref:Uncharacterized protein n=1 Tax=Plakobranchus ocellatus TaxID=259542 RepID=A0AAV4AX65_9GAST|nr:hypothetical protein PoB_003762100 [Plakobranchus ocellatus]
MNHQIGLRTESNHKHKLRCCIVTPTNADSGKLPAARRMRQQYFYRLFSLRVKKPLLHDPTGGDLQTEPVYEQKITNFQALARSTIWLLGYRKPHGNGSNSHSPYPDDASSEGYRLLDAIR